MKLTDLKKTAAAILQEGMFHTAAAMEAELIILDTLAISRQELLLQERCLISEQQCKQILELCRRRAAGEPLQYLTTTAYFRNLKLKVNSSVLIPRCETEILAGFVIEHAPRDAKILDLGTGSGAIAIAVAMERGDCQLSAVDNSERALLVAAENAKLNKQSVRFIHSDLFSSLGSRKFDLIAANGAVISEFPLQAGPEAHHFPIRNRIISGLSAGTIVVKEKKKSLFQFSPPLPNLV